MIEIRVLVSSLWMVRKVHANGSCIRTRDSNNQIVDWQERKDWRYELTKIPDTQVMALPKVQDHSGKAKCPQDADGHNGKTSREDDLGPKPEESSIPQPVCTKVVASEALEQRRDA